MKDKYTKIYTFSFNINNLLFI